MSGSCRLLRKLANKQYIQNSTQFFLKLTAPSYIGQQHTKQLTINKIDVIIYEKYNIIVLIHFKFLMRY